MSDLKKSDFSDPATAVSGNLIVRQYCVEHFRIGSLFYTVSWCSLIPQITTYK